MGWNRMDNPSARLFNICGTAIAVITVLLSVGGLVDQHSNLNFNSYLLLGIAGGVIAFLGFRASSISDNFHRWGSLPLTEKLIACIPIGVGVVCLFCLLLFINVVRDELERY